MSSSADVNLIASLNNVSAMLNRYFAIVIFIFGTIGNILNLFVLAQPTLRSNPCALFFLFSSIAHLSFIYSGLTTRILSGWAADLTATIGWLCKLRGFVLYTSRTVALWFIVLATVDRWLSSHSNARYRQMSTVKNACKSMILILSFSALLYVQLFYCYEANLINSPLPCYGRTELCRIVTAMFDAFVTVIMPIMFMMIFGMMTISNIRQTYRRLQPLPVATLASANNVTLTTQARNQQRSKKTDRHLMVMLFFQVIVLTLLSLPFTIVEIYSTLTATQYETPLQATIVNFVFNFALLLVYLCCGTPFYIYTLYGGSLFRSALLNVVKTAGRMMRCLPA
jgi:hypothetical protein